MTTFETLAKAALFVQGPAITVADGQDAAWRVLLCVRGIWTVLADVSLPGVALGLATSMAARENADLATDALMAREVARHCGAAADLNGSAAIVAACMGQHAASLFLNDRVPEAA